MNWLNYLIEANLYLAIFYAGYYLFLSNETHYTLNRIYLLLSCIASFIIPLIQIGLLKPAEPVINGAGSAFQRRAVMVNTMPGNMAHHFTLQDGIITIYLLGAGILLLMLLFKVYQLIKLVGNSKYEQDSGYKLVYLNDSITAFSFFNYLFIGAKAEGVETIITHELVHIRQKHSIDIIFIELIKIINWFNPFIYLLQHSLKALHEYIADEHTALLETDALTYSSFLVNNAYGLSGTSITHSFFNYNLLKKRIIMLNQKRSGNLARLKYLLAVPICAGLLCLSTLTFSKNYALVDLAPRHKNVLKVGKQADTTVKQLPPPPAPQVDAKEHKMPPPPSTLLIDTQKYKMPPPPPAPPVISVQLLPPPPPPCDSAYANLVNYLYKSLQYPADANANKTYGVVLAEFTLDKYHKISDVKIINGIGHGCDEEVVGLLKSYTESITKDQQYYRIAVSFNLVGKDVSLLAKNFDEQLINSPNFACAITVVGHVKDL